VLFLSRVAVATDLSRTARAPEALSKALGAAIHQITCTDALLYYYYYYYYCSNWNPCADIMPLKSGCC
jgi:hypothetical protein